MTIVAFDASVFGSIFLKAHFCAAVRCCGSFVDSTENAHFAWVSSDLSNEAAFGDSQHLPRFGDKFRSL